MNKREKYYEHECEHKKERTMLIGLRLNKNVDAELCAYLEQFGNAKTAEVRRLVKAAWEYEGRKTVLPSARHVKIAYVLTPDNSDFVVADDGEYRYVQSNVTVEERRPIRKRTEQAYQIIDKLIATDFHKWDKFDESISELMLEGDEIIAEREIKE